MLQLVWRSAYRDWYRLRLILEREPSLEPVVLFSLLGLTLTFLLLI